MGKLIEFPYVGTPEVHGVLGRVLVMPVQPLFHMDRFLGLPPKQKTAHTAYRKPISTEYEIIANPDVEALKNDAHMYADGSLPLFDLADKKIKESDKKIKEYFSEENILKNRIDLAELEEKYKKFNLSGHDPTSCP